MPSVRLVVKQQGPAASGAPEERVLAEDTIVIGRAENATVVLGDSTVSRNHARITCDGSLYFVEDLGSALGTRVNGSPLPKGEKRLLRSGDVLAIGPYDISFQRLGTTMRIDPADPAKSEESVALAKQVVKDALKGLASGEGPFLRAMNGEYEGQRYPIADAQELVVGREDGCDIVLHDDLVSRRHCKVRRDWSGTHVEDLGSRNGITVNHKKVASRTRLMDGDELTVGGTRFLFLDPAEVPEESGKSGPLLQASLEEGTELHPIPNVVINPGGIQGGPPSVSVKESLGPPASPRGNGAKGAQKVAAVPAPPQEEEGSASGSEKSGSNVEPTPEPEVRRPSAMPRAFQRFAGRVPASVASREGMRHLVPIIIGIAIVLAGIGFLIALFVGG